MPEVDGADNTYFQTREGFIIGAAQRGWRIEVSKERSDKAM
jgi:hypothetical protein